MTTLEKANLWKMNAKAKASALFLNIQGQELHRDMEDGTDLPNPLWPNSSHVEWGRPSRRNQKLNLG
jgi:hypothetical protein